MENGVHNDAQGGIITLVAKIQSTFRLRAETLEIVQRIAEKLDKGRPDVLELAITHLDVSLRKGDPIYMLPGPPDDEPKAHKRRHRVA